MTKATSRYTLDVPGRCSHQDIASCMLVRLTQDTLMLGQKGNSVKRGDVAVYALASVVESQPQHLVFHQCVCHKVVV